VDRKVACVARIDRIKRGKSPVRRFIVVHGECKLANVVAALHSTSRLASRLYRGQQQPNKNANDGNHDKEFNESEGAAWPEIPR
jgi:hypothetical protein